MQESDISANVRKSRFSDPFSLQSKQLQPGYVSSYNKHKFDIEKLAIIPCITFAALGARKGSVPWDLWGIGGPTGRAELGTMSQS
jgi:hypothetical protein